MHKENLRHDQEEKNEQINLDYLNEKHKANLRHNQAIIKNILNPFTDLEPNTSKILLRKICRIVLETEKKQLKEQDFFYVF